MNSSANGHRRLERRSIALHRAVAEAIQSDQGVLELALRNLSRWEQSAPGPWIDEWRRLLLGPRDILLSFLIEESEHADRLRQSSPFAGALSPLKRRRIYESHAA